MYLRDAPGALAGNQDPVVQLENRGALQPPPEASTDGKRFIAHWHPLLPQWPAGTGRCSGSKVGAQKVEIAKAAELPVHLRHPEKTQGLNTRRSAVGTFQCGAPFDTLGEPRAHKSLSLCLLTVPFC